MKYNWPLIKLEYITSPEQPSYDQLARRVAPRGKEATLLGLIKRRAKRENWPLERERYWREVLQNCSESTLKTIAAWVETRLESLCEVASEALEIEKEILRRFKERLKSENGDVNFAPHELNFLRFVSKKSVAEIREWRSKSEQSNLSTGLTVGPEIIEFLRERLCLDLEKLVKEGIPDEVLVVPRRKAT